MAQGGLLRAMPFLGIAVLVYLVGTALFGLALDRPLFAFGLPSGVQVDIRFSDLVIWLGLLLLFVELILSVRPTGSSLVNHALSMALFVGCGLAFLLVPVCGTTTFLALTILTLIDVVSGYSISIIAARRDLTLDDSR